MALERSIPHAFDFVVALDADRSFFSLFVDVNRVAGAHGQDAVFRQAQITLTCDSFVTVSDFAEVPPV